MPGGGPAANARLLVFTDDLPRREISADAEGRFDLSGDFHRHSTLIAESVDPQLQRRVTISTIEARSLVSEPLRIKLRDARTIHVRVLKDGEPVAGALVAVDRTTVPTPTDRHGVAALQLPDTADSMRISAWHPDLGIAGAMTKFDSNDPTTPTLELQLRPLQPRRIQVIDHRGQGVLDFQFCPSFRAIDSDWFLGRSFEKLVVTTGSTGEVEVPWAPARLQYVSIDGSPPDWVIDEVKPQAVDAPELTLVKVRRKRQLAGRLAVPDKCDPTGLCIVSQGFGPANRTDISATRAAADGSFSLSIAPEYAYAIMVCDRQWTSEPLTGVLDRLTPQTEPTPLKLTLEATTPLVVNATIGSQNVPLDDAYVSIRRIIDIEWINADGNKKRGQHSLSDWLKTNQAGTLRTGLGRGTYRIAISHENWREEKKLEVTSDDPITVTFHKPYEHRRDIRGRLAQGGRTSDCSDVKVTAVEYGPLARKTTEVRVESDGTFVLSTDCQKVDFFALDWRGAAAGKAMAGETASAVTVELHPTATYEGQVVGLKDRPISVVSLALSPQGASPVFMRRTTTDKEGGFFFDHVIPGIPLRLSASVAGKDVVLEDSYFEPGESRRGVRLRLEADERDDASQGRAPLTQQIEVRCRDARLARMKVLVGIHDDDDAGRKFIERSVLDYDEVRAVLDYLPLMLHSTTLRLDASDDAYTRKAGWPMPAAKQVTLIALDGASQLLGTATIPIDSSMASAQARRFLDEHRPQAVNGDELWRSAFAEAKQSGRRVIVQFGGPRCGPCFLLSRWMDDHHQPLERDYVILKLHPFRQHGASEIEQRLRATSGGIPWMAILDAEENVLATSDGPLGNIGYPTSFEGVRHFRRMLEKTAHRLSPDDITALVATLRN